MDPAELEALFAPMGRVTLRRMFSGHGVYIGTACLALAAKGQVWIKADLSTESALAAAGSRPFSMETPEGGEKTMRAFWTLPEAAFEDPDELKRWCGPALAAAQRTAAEKAAKLTAMRRRQEGGA